MQNMKAIVSPAPTIITRPFAGQKAQIENDFPAIDPYQEFFNYLVAQGTGESEAWDMVWENPRRAAQIGMKLAAYRIEPNMEYALAS